MLGKTLLKLSVAVVLLLVPFLAFAEGESEHEEADLFAEPWPAAPLPPQGPLPVDALPATSSLSAQSCGICHQKQYSEWQTSMHRNSFIDPLHQAVLKEEGIPFCSGCHLPLTEQAPVLIRGYEGGDITKPIIEANRDFIPALMSEGLTCAACHVRNWVRYGPPEHEHEEEAEAHEVTLVSNYEKAEFCANCHQEGSPIPGLELAVPFINTYNQWKDSPYSKKGVTCQTCHMPGGDHTWRGGHDSDMVRSAVSVSVTTDKESYSAGDTGSATVRITNIGAGHKFPAGGSGGNARMVILTSSIVDQDDRTLTSKQDVIMRVMKEPPPFTNMFIESSDSRIDPGEERIFQSTYTFPSGATGKLFLRTTLEYHLFPPPALRAFGLSEMLPPVVIYDEKTALN